MQVIKGIPAASGIAIGPGFQHSSVHLIPARLPVIDGEAELKRLEDAIERSEKELQEIYRGARETVGEEAAEIFQAHLMMLKDPDLLETVKQTIERESINAEAAFYEASERYAELLQNLADEYLQARAAD